MKPGLFNLLEKVAAPSNRAFLNSHFEDPSWSDFKKKLKSQKFVDAVVNDPRANKKLQRYSEANSMHMRAKNVETFPVPSQSGPGSYDVKYHPQQERFSCDCGDWVHARSWKTGKHARDCKHVRLVKMELKNSGQSQGLEINMMKKTAIAMYRPGAKKVIGDKLRGIFQPGKESARKQALRGFKLKGDERYQLAKMTPPDRKAHVAASTHRRQMDILEGVGTPEHARKEALRVSAWQKAQEDNIRKHGPGKGPGKTIAFPSVGNAPLPQRGEFVAKPSSYFEKRAMLLSYMKLLNQVRGHE